MAKAERDIQTAIMNMLLTHPKVAFAHVTTNGTFKVKGSWMTVGFIGQSDIVGMMRDGRFLAIEVKQPGKFPTPDQIEFIELVNRNNGIAGWTDSVEGAIDIIDDRKNNN